MSHIRRSNINISDENFKRKRISPKYRFRALVRRVIANGPWLLEPGESKIHGSKFFLLRKALKSELSIRQKAILNIAPELRTPEETIQVYKIIQAFKCFRKYPENVKSRIASIIRFAYFGPDRVIVRENHIATGIYFLISGELVVVDEKYDKFLDETERIVVRKLVSGEPFGEINIAYNIPRIQTIVSSTPVELLIITREAFELKLKDTVMTEWAQISKVLSTFNYFQSWSKVDIGECCLESVIKNFKKYDTVLGDGYGRKNCVYFVVKGSCDLIEDLLVERIENRFGKTKYRLYEPPEEIIKSLEDTNLSTITFASFHDAGRKSSESVSETSLQELVKSRTMNYLLSQNNIRNAEVVFMKICTFGQMSCFSVGEPMFRRRIVANEDLTCLIIPYILLVSKDNVFLRIKQYLTRTLPTSEAVFQKFVKGRQWCKYKAEVVKPLLTTYRSNWISNIPYSIRVNQDLEFKREKTVLTSTFRMKQLNRGAGSRAF